MIAIARIGTLTAAALLGVAHVALGVPAPTITGSPASPTAAVDGTFTWSAVPPSAEGNSIRYDGGIGSDAAEDFGSFTSATPALPEGVVTFRVRAVELSGADGSATVSDYASVRLVVDRSAPVISGEASPGPNRFGWSTRPVTVSFSCADAESGIAQCPDPVVVDDGRDQARSGTARNGVGLETSTAVSGIDVDTAPPGVAPLGAPGAGAIVADRRITFSWTAPADATSGVVGYQIFIDNPRGSGSAPFTTGTSYARPADLAPGRHTWFVRTIDVARNVSDSELREFVIDTSTPATGGGTSGGGGGDGGGSGAPGPDGSTSGGPIGGGGASDPAAAPQPEETTTGGGRTVLRPPTDNARLLSPRAGLRVRTLQPVLRWSRLPRGTTLSNIQVFRMRGRVLTKVHSAFPRSTRYRLPDGVLRPGETYVWRVWPFRGRRGFTPRPLAVSWFRLSGVAEMLPAAARARIVAPARPRAARGEALAVRWRARPGIRRYKVTLERLGRPVLSDLAVGTRFTVPGSALARRGTYAVIVRSARKGSLRRFTPAPWAAVAVRVR